MAPGRRQILIFVIRLGMALAPLMTAGQSVTIGWTPTPTASATGYMVYQSTDGINFDGGTDAGTNTSWTVNDLTPSTTYYFQVIAYSSSATPAPVQGPPSGMIVYSVPAGTESTATVVANPAGAGTVGGGGSFATGAPVTVTAVANSGYVFTNWTVNGAAVSSAPIYTFTLDGSETLVANFTTVATTNSGQASTNYTVGVTASPTAGGSAAGAGTFAAGSIETVTATPAAGYAFVNWTINGAVAGTTPVLACTVNSNTVLQANFVADAVPPVAGTYRGLFYSTNEATEDSSGAIVATVTAAGAYSAKVTLSGGSYSFSGMLSSGGSTSRTINRRSLNPLSVQLQWDGNAGTLTGNVTDGAWTSELLAVPGGYSTANPAPQAGKYTLLFPGATGATNQPAGNGFGAATLGSSGRIGFAGTLGDGTPVAFTGAVTTNGLWPVYAPLYAGQGLMLGWLTITNGGIGGQINWFKLPQPAARAYPAGFTNSVEIVGSSYAAGGGQSVLGFNEGNLSLVDGNLATGITNQVSFAATVGLNEAATSASAPKLTFFGGSGLFKGTVLDPANGKLIAFSGAVLQNQNLAAGMFLGSTESGSVVLTKTP